MLITGNVLRHLGVQLATGAAVAVLAYLSKADYSSLGVYAPLVQMLAATATSIFNEAIGSAPSKS